MIPGFIICDVSWNPDHSIVQNNSFNFFNQQTTAIDFQWIDPSEINNCSPFRSMPSQWRLRNLDHNMSNGWHAEDAEFRIFANWLGRTKWQEGWCTASKSFPISFRWSLHSRIGVRDSLILLMRKADCSLHAMTALQVDRVVVGVDLHKLACNRQLPAERMYDQSIVYLTVCRDSLAMQLSAVV